jgi:AAA domain/Protein of unknown function (DUF4011)/REase_MTES_1575
MSSNDAFETRQPFEKLLDLAVESGGLEAEDIRVALGRFMREVADLHEVGCVGSLQGLDSLQIDDQFRVTSLGTSASLPSRNRTKLEAIQKPESQAFRVTGEQRLTFDVDNGIEGVESLDVVAENESIIRPVFVLGYEVWEHRIAHHDELADIESIGLLLASLALGLDFRRRADLDLFVTNRRNLFAVNSRLHPVLARLINEMAEPDRNVRAQDLASLADRLEMYRDQPLDFDLERIDGATTGSVRGRRAAIQQALRDRLFEISRRNRLVYFQPSQQALNLTLGSVPLLLDVRNIEPTQIATWKAPLSNAILQGKGVALNTLLRFEDAPYMPGVLDKLISQARRDRAEYGMAQLRLVICFLRWHNLKEVKDERINSPLLLLPIELVKKRGVRDSYVLTATSSTAEVNPALRHYLRQLYNIELPEFVDLETQSVDELYENLVTQIQSSEPGVVLTKVDRPPLELVHQRAKMRLDQYSRRQRSAVRRTSNLSYSYSYGPGIVRPLGIQIFDAKLRYSAPGALRIAAGATPTPRMPALSPTEDAPESNAAVTVTERKTYSLKDQASGNPYQWEFDLCSLTVSNFNYRKMTLVRDYTEIVSADQLSDSFDRIFSLDARPVDDAADFSLPLDQQHLIVPADETQRAAIARSRTGRSFIIQGPPGTGKSQTITNLIADYVARGKRVLFVCEKRAAIDVVHARLRGQGLDELCAVIHDSQVDKKAFIQDCKSTYESWLTSAAEVQSQEGARDSILTSMQSSVRSIERVDVAMSSIPVESDVPLRSLYERAVELQKLPKQTHEHPAGPDAVLSSVREWHVQESAVRRLAATLTRLGEPPVLALHPLAEINVDVLGTDRPHAEIARLAERVLTLNRELAPQLRLLGLDPEAVTDSELVELALLGDRITMFPTPSHGILRPGSPAFADLVGTAATQTQLRQQLDASKADVVHWRDPLTLADATAGLQLATDKETSGLKFLSGSWRSLKKTIEARYDFGAHAVRPTLTSVLGALVIFHQAQLAVNETEDRALGDYGNGDLNVVVDRAKKTHSLVREHICSLRDEIALSQPSRAQSLADCLPLIHETVLAHSNLFAASDPRTLPELDQRAERLRGSAGSVGELFADLRAISSTPTVADAIRTLRLGPDSLEKAIVEQAIRRFGGTNLDVERFTGREFALHLEMLASDHRSLLDANASLVRSRVRSRFLENVAISSLSVTQLSPAQKSFKKVYTTGRRELEHEFSKTMRYRSIRDLASGETGAVMMDLRPIWLMSPLSVSDTLPLDPSLFDVVIFDEASQIPLEEAVPALYRSHQTIVVGDQMQLPPTQFFRASTAGDDEVEVEDDDGQRVAIVLDGDSFLAKSASSLPSAMLAWHYRSRSEDLIGFSNAAFYGGALATVPDLHRPPNTLAPINVPSADVGGGPAERGEHGAAALLDRNVSFHFVEDGVYESRRNTAEADYVAHVVRALLVRKTGMTIGVAAFSEAQQTEIESALERLALSDPAFALLLETEESREDDGQFVGLFVKNLENIQGDERDIIIMSVCYGPGPTGRMVMSFGPINQRGGEKRLNVIFSRAKKHMAIVSSIRSSQITNVHNDGANTLRGFLDYAEALSVGAADRANALLDGVNPLGRRNLVQRSDSIIPDLAASLRSRGLHVHVDHGRSRFRCDLAVRRGGDVNHRVAVLVDTADRSMLASVEERSIIHPMVLGNFGWRVVHVLTKDWWSQPDLVLRTIEKAIAAE